VIIACCFYCLPFGLEENHPACCTLLVHYLLDLLFDPEDGGSMFLRYLSEFLLDYTALYSKRQRCLYLVYSPLNQRVNDHRAFHPTKIICQICSSHSGERENYCLVGCDNG
jgi:hypothetical protein